MPKNETEYKIGKDNQIFTRANKLVNSELGVSIMIEASKTIWGEKMVYKGLQRTLVELMQNTNNHADSNDKGIKHWWLSINHDKHENKVSFIFIDYGVGIFKSLEAKNIYSKWYGWYKRIKNRIIDKLKHGGRDEILKLLLEGEIHKTVTGESFRGKGLPGIKETLDRNQISNLIIISNDVFADVKKNNYKKLNNEFRGTFVSWELNKQNEKTEWNIK